jgi:hypothetical protein
MRSPGQPAIVVVVIVFTEWVGWRAMASGEMLNF